MNTWFGGFSKIVIALGVLSVGCMGSIAKRKELLLGDWILVNGQWHDGFRLNQDSIYVLVKVNNDGFSPLNPSFAVPYELTYEDSLIFGTTNENEIQWGLNKSLEGRWKIIHLTEDSLSIATKRDTLHFYRKTK